MNLYSTFYALDFFYVADADYVLIGGFTVEGDFNIIENIYVNSAVKDITGDRIDFLEEE